SSKAGLGSRCSTLCRVPVKKLSTHSTSHPCASSRSHRCDPRNPAPPVTRTRLRREYLGIRSAATASEGGYGTRAGVGSSVLGALAPRQRGALERPRTVSQFSPSGLSGLAACFTLLVSF